MGLISKNFSLLICIVASLFVVFNMYTGNHLFLWLFMLLTLTAMLWDKQQHRIEYLLFFISWVYVMKFDFASYSLFVVLSFVYIVLSMWTLFIQNKGIAIQLIITYMSFICFTVVVTLFSRGNVIEVLGFVLNYSVLFFAVLFIDSSTYFKSYVYLYTYGLLTAAIVRWISFSVQALDHYIESMTIVNTVKTANTINTRFTGLDLDPNYFSLQILIAIACLFVLFYEDRQRKVQTLLLMMALAIFGILTYSKMFIITLLVFILLTFIIFVYNNVQSAIKFASFILVICSSILLFFYERLFEIYWLRFFGAGTSTDAITTGRVSSWYMFAAEILHSAKIVVVGAGFGTNFSNVKMAHTMYLSTPYYLGFVGILLALLYIFSVYKVLCQNIGDSGKTNFQLLAVNAIPLYIMLIANTVLDSFIMDYFPFHMLLIMFALTLHKSYDRGMKQCHF